ncbi:MAG: flavodoxin domain-containing protein [Bacillota bacterium]
MKTLVAYATKYGAAKKCAERLVGKLEGEVDLINIKEKQNININNYDKVIIGSSVYMGKIRKEARKFCDKYLEELKSKKLGLFNSCMSREEEAREQLKNSFSDELVQSAEVTGIFGGAFDFDKMNFLEKMAIKKIAGTDKSESNIREENITEFASKINAC